MLRKIFQLDWVMIVAIVMLLSMSLLMMYSLSSSGQGEASNNFSRQLAFAGVGLVLMFFMALTDYHYLLAYSRKIYFATLIVLTLVLLIGIKVRGTVGWLSFGLFNIQPVEFAKVALIVFLASFISRKKTVLSESIRVLASLVFSGLVFFLVLKQPDLGSTLILMAIWGGMVLLSGVSRKSLLIIFLAGMVIAGSAWFFLADYQKDRIKNILNPQFDPRGASYNVIQSIVAIGSGGLVGQGVGKGSQSQLNFLPEKYTDFVFAVIAEELGIAGVVLCLMLFAVLIYRVKLAAELSPDNFGYLLSAGVIIMLFVQIVINVGMNIGILPVTGIPLPLLSLGGSSLIAILGGLGVVLNIGSRQPLLKYKD